MPREKTTNHIVYKTVSKKIQNKKNAGGTTRSVLQNDPALGSAPLHSEVLLLLSLHARIERLRQANAAHRGDGHCAHGE